jgi:hypothetical protein
MMRKRRSGADSRCCTPAPVAYVWRDYRDQERQAAVELDTWMSTLPVFERLHQEGENDDLLEAAARGELWDSGDETTKIKPIVTNPDIYELRRTALTKKLRFYHGEPSELPLMLIGLHRHMKTDNTSQQVEIQHAADRYIAGHPSFWVQ